MMFYPFIPFLPIPRIVKTLSTVAYTASTTEGDVTTPASLLITPSKTISNLENGNRIAFIVTNSVPTEGAATPVTITINGENIPVYDRYGNIIYGASLRSQTVLKAYYGTDGADSAAHLIVVNYPFF